MSSRQLRRALAEREKDNVVEIESEDEAIQTSVQLKSSLFALVSGGNSLNADILQLEDKDASEEEMGNDPVSEHEEKDEEEAKAPIQASLIRKKKKKKKTKSEVEKAPPSSEEFDLSLLEDFIEEDVSASAGLLKVQIDHLDPSIELKKRFGRNFVPPPPEPDQRFANLIDRVKKAIFVKRKGRSQLIPQNPSWPTVPLTAIGLGLEKAVSDDELQQDLGYSFKHSDDYRQAMMEALSYISMGDIDGLVYSLRVHPYQIDALLVVSDYVRMSSAGEAAELVEWAIALMEKAFVTQTSFKPYDLAEHPDYRWLPYDYPENRKFHLALFRHIQYLLKKGCYRTAWEFGKLCQCLDYLDPLFISAILDYAAIQAKQYRWVMDMHDSMYLCEWNVCWDYSVALAQFLAEERWTADASLEAAIKRAPYVLPFLMDAVGASDFSSKSWRDMYEPGLKSNDHLMALSKIWAMRSGPLWKIPERLSWLSSIVERFVTKRATIEVGKIPAFPQLDSFADHAPIYRHAVISDLPNLNVAVPKQLSKQPTHAFNPYPPELVDVVGGDGLLSRLAAIFNRL